MDSYNVNLYPFESKWVMIDGNQIHYIDEGEGEIILFSHPPLGSSYMHRDIVRLLRGRYRCIAIDYPGFGLSIPHKDYKVSIEGQGSILKKFIEQLQLQDIYILGHDTGGPSAFVVAILNPKLFKGLILTDTIIYPVSEYQKISVMLGIVGAKFFTWLNANTNFLVNTTTKYGIKTRRLTLEERKEYQRMFDTRVKRKRITQMLHSLKQSESLMQKVKQGFETTLNAKPALLIYGEKDPVNELGISRRIHLLLPNSELFLIDNEGHFPHEGQPAKISQIIDNWIKRITTANALSHRMDQRSKHGLSPIPNRRTVY